MKALLIAALLVPLAGCSTLKRFYQSDPNLLATLAQSVTGPACQAAAGSLQPTENAQVCTNLAACSAAFCTVPTP